MRVATVPPSTTLALTTDDMWSRATGILAMKRYRGGRPQTRSMRKGNIVGAVEPEVCQERIRPGPTPLTYACGVAVSARSG